MINLTKRDKMKMLDSKKYREDKKKHFGWRPVTTDEFFDVVREENKNAR